MEQPGGDEGGGNLNVDEKDLIGLILGVFPVLALASFVYRDYLAGSGKAVSRAHLRLENLLFAVAGLEIVLIAFSAH
ncbi:hypothetical protein D3C84_422450 [compost metagenome]